MCDQLTRMEKPSQTASQLRAGVVCFLRSNPTISDGIHFGEFVNHGGWETYLRRMSMEGEWGDYIALLGLGCYPQRPKAEVDNTLRDLQNSSYPTKAEFNNCFIIHSKYFLLVKGVSPLLSLFFRSPNITQPCPQVFSINGSIIYGGLHFWRHFDVIGSIILSTFHFWRHWFSMAKILSKFGEEQLVMVNYARGFNQSETGKYFEWIIINNYSTSARWIWVGFNQTYIQQARME